MERSNGAQPAVPDSSHASKPRRTERLVRKPGKISRAAANLRILTYYYDTNSDNNGPVPSER